MAKLSQAKLDEIRKTTLRAVQCPECCGTCQHWWNHWNSGPNVAQSCMRVVARGKITMEKTTFFQLCDLYERKDSQCPTTA